ncbi:hypothetical protein CL656_06015 [bacterium]|nr:hypothetical protein [bacterium]|tara:strand:+ start:3445 stop:4704 length:1260 start_codon:yes stop_codon:yes gene_type:complete
MQRISLVNPYSGRGGASLGTYRLYKFLCKFYPSKIIDLEVVIDTKTHPASRRSNYIFQGILLLQSLINKLLVKALSKGKLEVGYSFLIPISLPALFIYLRIIKSNKVYLHSLGSGFACFLSLPLLINKAKIAKQADEWMLTGGCHYTYGCKELENGCSNCPHFNYLGRMIIRHNFKFKRNLLENTSIICVSPSKWLQKKFADVIGERSRYIPNSAQNIMPSKVDNALINNFKKYDDSIDKNLLTIGIAATYLNDKRKNFQELIPIIIKLLRNGRFNIILCGRDSNNYKLIIKSKIKDSDIGRLYSYGNLNPLLMNLFYKKNDIIIHAADYDNSPNIVTESIAQGVPCLVTDKCGNPEHIRASLGGCVVDNLNNIYNKLVELEKDRKLLRIMSTNAFNYSKTILSPKAMADSYYNLLMSS